MTTNLPVTILCGHEWRMAYSNDLILRLQRGDDALYVHRSPSPDGTYPWGLSRIHRGETIGTVYGRADTQEDAAAAAIACNPPMDRLDHKGFITTWMRTAREDGLRWSTSICGELCEVFPDPLTKDRYRWERRTDALDRFPLGFCHELGATAPDAVAAMVAAIEAHETFRSACAALVASLNPRGQARCRDFCGCRHLPHHRTTTIEIPNGPE